MNSCYFTKPALFLDRDGVILAEVNGAAPKRPDDVRLLPRMVSVLQDIVKRSWPLVLISNQPDYALGQVSLSDRHLIEGIFLKLLADSHIHLTRVYYCYHHPKGVVPELSRQCTCRKPEPGLLFLAEQELGIDLSRSYFVGDRATDIKAGRLAGVATILFDENDSQGPFLQQHQVSPDFTVRNPEELLGII